MLQGRQMAVPVLCMGIIMEVFRQVFKMCREILLQILAQEQLLHLPLLLASITEAVHLLHGIFSTIRLIISMPEAEVRMGFTIPMALLLLLIIKLTLLQREDHYMVFILVAL